MTTDPSYLTTSASMKLIGSLMQPYSVDIQDSPPLRMVPPTPMQGVRAAVTSLSQES